MDFVPGAGAVSLVPFTERCGAVSPPHGLQWLLLGVAVPVNRARCSARAAFTRARIVAEFSVVTVDANSA
jgi:hypothetical protein